MSGFGVTGGGPAWPPGAILLYNIINIFFSIISFSPILKYLPTYLGKSILSVMEISKDNIGDGRMKS